ncbi:GNAT family N-acetyltransferase [Nocardia sp. CDC159]|uniref:GNAT family N-acetyltransferase n=1 Tax=Nocardia pulmonis TaxID=2951408 RepID=A0A9X2J0J2_9NOCA|nr:MULTISPECIES: GNAT family N-acetyltransferase [Nocardia]MCM6778613.1 GNAT family N-acetyltransferase [Nocardia pulmonis]MCM6791502.1 GNAT family N-acetyltransferase [Nocardia sp. CDC159]
MTTIEILADDAEIRGAHGIFRTAMVGLPPLPSDAEGLWEPGRVLGARIDGELVGTANSYTSWLAVPGGERIAHAAVTHVGVLPTHTRRGVVTALLRHQLADFAARGEIVATLRASQGGIYERFGYGVATAMARAELDPRRARLRDTVPASGPVRFLDLDVVWESLAKIYAAQILSRPGAIGRSQYWWRLQELTHASPGYVVAHGLPGSEDGFARYRPRDTTDWPRSPHRTIVVDDLVAATPRAQAGLVRHLLSIDVADTIVFPTVAPDFPLRHLLTDERATTLSAIRDETWLRLIDVLAALRRRTYRPGSELVLAVTDPIRTANSGAYRISAESVTRTTETADLTTDIAALSAAYLGGTSWRHLALAGRVRGGDPEAVARADELFGVGEAPFSGTWF